jgi:ribonucleoside-diphosphate reductase beta chain
VLRQEYAHLFDAEMESKVYRMIEEAIEVEMSFCEDALSFGVTGISPNLMKEYLQYCADQRLVQLGFKKRYAAKNPFAFMLLQDMQPLTNFFEKKVTEYQKGFDASKANVVFDANF